MPRPLSRTRTPGSKAPDLDVTCWFHQPAHDSEWLLVDYECRIAKDALMNATGRVWSGDGRLLATGGARLLCVPIGAGVPPPPPIPHKQTERPA